jgi:N-acetylmuramoyl-L-alanine amidase
MRRTLSPPSYTDDDIDAVARTIWGEARGEGVLGMRAVAHVIANRVHRPCWWGTTWRSVCWKARQFSCWNTGDVNKARMATLTFSDAAFRQAYAIAASVMAGLDADDITGGADHYHADSVTPEWRDEAKRTGSIGHHVFYRLEEA